jgi:hypothetical protein
MQGRRFVSNPASSALTRSKDSAATVGDRDGGVSATGTSAVYARWHKGRRHLRCTICLSQCTSIWIARPLTLLTMRERMPVGSVELP